MVNSTKTRNEIQTKTAFLSYEDNILHIRLKAGEEMTIHNVKEQSVAIRQLVSNEYFFILVDGTTGTSITQEAGEYLAKNTTCNALATAIVSNNNLATLLLANFFIRVFKPLTNTKVFKTENEALNWLGTLV